MSRTARVAVGPLVLSTVVFGAVACSRDDSGVQIGVVERETVTEVVEAPASIAARASATLSSPAPGTIVELDVDDGQQVRAGQVLLRIHSPQAEEQLRQARKADAEVAASGRVRLPSVDLSATERQADQAAADAFAAARRSAEQIPDPKLRQAALAQVEQTHATYQAARADANQAIHRFNAGLGSLGEALSSLSRAQRVQTRSAVALAQQTVDALTVRAPISGVVTLGGTGGGAGDLSALLGQLPQGGEQQGRQLLRGGLPSAGQATIAEGAPVTAGTPLVTITDTSELSVTAEVAETDVLLVRPGVPADIELDAVPGARYSATVRSVGVTPTTNTRGGVSYTVRLALGAGKLADGTPAPVPKPGMSAVAYLRVRTVSDAVAVPSSAVVREGDRDTVWVVVGDRLRRREVKLGAQGDANVQVVSGLKVGDRIVVRGADRVRDGQEVPG
ncbi:efflux transporter periplasmic adaptor subunit [Carbonactinospora thermoautotrophica]|uniref:efflux RND transporter periplasmic adaptor subunit n=1 Tax=Carbonactinospora thermoautotrophica TaxID=1469144 RepID=UPI00227125CB|nr:efflux RND transporter periplasmic adaptor subunit [Carbonactinospora thermoautotrophica]MCX9191505.1 efflux transporter periplasmic adaptor subunit [Carbonactinospora thermoautotrophica]